MHLSCDLLSTFGFTYLWCSSFIWLAYSWREIKCSGVSLSSHTWKRNIPIHTLPHTSHAQTIMCVNAIRNEMYKSSIFMRDCWKDSYMLYTPFINSWFSWMLYLESKVIILRLLSPLVTLYYIYQCKTYGMNLLFSMLVCKKYRLT